MKNQNVKTFHPGDHIQGGRIPQDYDHGIITEIRQGRALVTWQWSGDEDWCPLAGLEPYDEQTEEDMAAALGAEQC